MIIQSLNTIDLDTDFPMFFDSQITHLERQFSGLLQKFAALNLGWVKASLNYLSENGKLIDKLGIGCHCFDGFGAAVKIRNQHLEQEVFFNGVGLGKLILCCPGSLNAKDYLSQLLNFIFDELNRREDEAALLAELGTSWESLQAVYDLNTDFNTFHNLQKLLQKITERVTIAVGKETKAVLWLENDEYLSPVAATNITGLKPRPKGFGFIGDIFTKKQSVICNDILDKHILTENDVELQNAFRYAIFPVATRINIYGVLAVWQEKDNNIFDSHTSRLLATMAMQAAMVIETDRLHNESIQNEKLQQEIEIGSNIQQILLTENPPESIRGIKIFALTIPSKQIDGDFYDFIEHGDDCVDLIIGDVMGKGIPAALVGAATKSCFLRSVAQLQSFEKNLRPDPEKIVSWVNSEMTAKLIQFESFVTACYARFDLKKKYLTFVDCGHTKSILYSYRNQQISLLEGDNMPLGFSEREIFIERKLKLNVGDILFFFSDGITEARSPEGEMFGDERLSEFIKDNAGSEPKRLISDLLKTLREFSGEINFQDDLTCVAVRIDEVLTTEADGTIRLKIDNSLRELQRVRQFVRTVAKMLFKKAISETSVEQFELAVNEVVTNIIRHAFSDKSEHLIELVAGKSIDELQISLVYGGEKFDPQNVPPPSFDGSRDGGFGLFIISNCVDRVIYSHDLDKHTISLTKKVTKVEKNRL